MKKHYPNLDILRLIAALSVAVGVHWQAHVYGLPLKFFVPFDPVPVFVCLSGILIPASFETSRDWSHFSWKRLVRVVPAFLIALLLSCLLGGWQTLGPNLTLYATLGFVVIAGANNGVLWSLLVEEVLYASHIVAQVRKLWTPTFAAIAMATCIALWFALRFDLAGNNATRAAVAFFAGNLLYFNLNKLEGLSGWWFVAGFLFWRFVPPFFFESSLTHPMKIVSVIISSTTIVMAFRNLPQVKWRIPDLSYGCYVYHAPLLIFGIKTLSLNGMDLLAWLLVSTFSVSTASWYLVEKPLRKLKNRPWQFPKKSPEPRVLDVAA